MSGRSAIVEDGDGEMTVPPVLMPVTEIFSPLLNLQSIPLLSQDTWFSNSVLQGAGLTPVQSVNFPTFTKGRWDLDITFTMQFSGTINVNSSAAIAFFDPFVSVQNIISFACIVAAASGGSQLTASRTLRMLFVNDGWLINHSIPALVLGDVMYTSANVYARRVF